jgi:hypothetical protein
MAELDKGKTVSLEELKLTTLAQSRDVKYEQERRELNPCDNAVSLGRYHKDPVTVHRLRFMLDKPVAGAIGSRSRKSFHYVGFFFITSEHHTCDVLFRPRRVVVPQREF